METVIITCYKCNGAGKTVVTDIQDGYGEKQTCHLCKGEGEIKEAHPKYF